MGQELLDGQVRKVEEDGANVAKTYQGRGTRCRGGRAQRISGRIWQSVWAAGAWAA